MKLPPLNVVQHMVAPGYEQARGLPLNGETIQGFLDRMQWDFKIPTICVLNGERPLLRSEWAVTRADYGHITFVSRPHGGGSSGGGSKAIQVAGIVAMIALAAAAPWAAGALAPLIGITTAAGTSALAAGIALGGGMLISTLVRTLAGGQNQDTLPDAGQVYSLQAAQNSAKPLSVIPVNYGRQKLIPPYGSSPWAEYMDNTQYLNIQLTVGVGDHFVEQILIDDTILWDHITGVSDAFNASDIQLQFCPPGTPVTLFPTNIESSTEVTGQEFPGPNPDSSVWLGGYIVNASGTQINKFVIDVAFPGGLYFQNGAGEYFPGEVFYHVNYRTVDNAGTPTSDWVEVDFSVSNMTKTPLRFSFPFDVPAGRYEVRANRLGLPDGQTLVANPKGTGDSFDSVSYTIQQPINTDSTSQDMSNWVGLRGYVIGSASYEHEYNIALRLQADAQLTGQSSRNIGVICTRILPVWTGSAFENQATQSPLWAFWDAATNSLYGAKRPVSKVDFQGVLDAAADATSRGDTFNYTFSSFVTVPDALDTILASCRSKHCWVGDVLSVVRDEWRSIPSMLLTDSQIVRGSLEIISIFNDETGVDSIIGEFLNETTWRPAEIQFPPNTMSFTSTTPSRIRINGVTNPDQMLREVGFMWNQSQLRRTKVNLSTGHEGRMLKLMSAVNVQSHLPRSWGQSGEVVSKAVDGVTLTVNRDLTFSASEQNYVEFRDKRSRYFGPVKCSQVGILTNKILVDATDLAIVEADQGMTLDAALARMDGAEPPVFVLGIGTELSRSCMLLQAKPNGDTVDLVMVLDYEDVHDGDFGDVGPMPEPPAVLNPKIPVVQLLQASFIMGVAESRLTAQWWPATGALGYIAQISYNGGTTWKGFYEGSAPSFNLVADAAELVLRVQAYNTTKGPWSQTTVEAPTIVIQPGAVAPVSMQAGLHDWVMNIIKDNEDIARSIRQIIANAAAELDAGNYTDQKEMKRNLVSQVGNATATFTEQINVATGPGSAIVTSITSLTAQVGTNTANITTNANAIATTNGAVSDLTTSVGVSIGALNASVTTNSTAIGTITGRMAATWGLTLDVNHYIVGMQFLNDGTTSALVFNTDNFSIAKPGVLSPITMLSLQLVGGVTTLALRGDFIADGTILARALSVSTLSSITANIGTVTAGVIQSPTGKYVIDLNNERELISD